MLTRQERTALLLGVAVVVATIPLTGGVWAAPDATGANITETNATGANITETNATGANETTDWPQSRADAGQTGATGDSGPHPYPTTGWEVDYTMLDRSDEFLKGGPTASPTVANGTVYVPRWTDHYAAGHGLQIDHGHRGTVVARNVTTGEVLWAVTGREETQKHGIGKPTGSVAVANGTAYVSSEDDLGALGAGDDTDILERNGGLFALDAATGDVRWKRNETWSWGPPVVDDGSIYAVERANSSNLPFDDGERGIQNRDTRLHALDPETGETKWTEENATFLAGVADGTVYVVNSTIRADAPNENDLIALDAETGEVRWCAERAVEGREAPDPHIRSESWSDAVAATPEHVYVTRNPNRTVAYDATDGSQVWSRNLTSSPEWSEPAAIHAPAVANGSVYLTTRGTVSNDPAENEWVSTIHALNATTGERQWRFETAATLGTAPSVGNGTVYAYGSKGGTDTAGSIQSGGVVYALNATDGTRQWGYGFSGPGSGDIRTRLPPTVADGTFLLSSEPAPMLSGGSLQILDSTGDPLEDARIVNDTPRRPNQRPTLSIETEPPDALEGEVPGETNVTLVANASDPDGEVASIEWEVGGDVDGFATTGESVTVDVPACGVVQVTVRVTDDDGDSVRKTVEISARNVFTPD